MSEEQPEEKKGLLKRAWAWNRGWLILVLLAIAAAIIWSPLLKLPPVTAETPHILYLLSAIAQSLAAVLALVFTISLIVAQLSSRYSHRMLASFFDIPTVLYILLFIAAVFIPFWFLAEPNTWAVKASLTLAAACLLFFIPYFLSFKNKLNPEIMLENLKQKASNQLKASLDEGLGEISTIDNTVMSAFVLKDYGTFEKGVEALADLALEAYEGKKDAIGEAILIRLRDIGLATIEDPRAPRQVAEALCGVGFRALAKGLEDAAGNAVKCLAGVGSGAAGKGLEDAATQAAGLLNVVGMRAVLKGLGDTAGQAAGFLGVVGRMAAKKGLEGAARQFAGFLCGVGIRAAGRVLEEVVSEAARSLGRIGAMAAEKGLEGAASEAAISLGGVGAEAVAKGLESAASEVAISLWELGAWATFTENHDVEGDVANSLREVNSTTSAELIQLAFKDAEKSFSQDPRRLREALQRFKASNFPE